MNRQASGAGAGLVAAVTIVISACGPTNTSTAGQPTDAPTSAPAATARPGGVTGMVAAVTASDVQVQNPQVGQVRVTFTPSTSFTKTVAAAAGDLVIGNCALAIATPQAAGAPPGPLPATSVLISPPAADGGCPAGGFGAPGRGQRRGRGATASGRITSVSGTSFVIGLGADPARSVTTTQATTFTKTATTDKSALAVGQCVTAVGPSDDTGTVAASSIIIRQPGPNGCGGPGRPGRGAANGNGS